MKTIKIAIIKKLIYYFFISFISLGIMGCIKPIGNSLLVKYSSSCQDCSSNTSDSANDKTLDIQPSNSTLSANLDVSDSIEITGSCKDLGRKNNKILVEAFAGEDENAIPYINNSISDYCFSANNPLKTGLESVFLNSKSVVMGTAQTYDFSASGGVAPYTFSLVSGAGAIDPSTGIYTSPGANTLAVIQVSDGNGDVSRATITVLTTVTTTIANLDNKKCFSVTSGLGKVEDAGLPSEKTFPQCHNGVFGFSVRLGKALLNTTAGQANQKYSVRFKLRTQDGSVSDSAWSRVTIDRTISTPAIQSAINSITTVPQKCTIKTNASRFNMGLSYTLNRTYTDTVSSNAGSSDLYAGGNASSTLAGSSIFEWDDSSVVYGVKYNYTLSVSDALYSYTPSTPIISSTPVTCETTRPVIQSPQKPTTSVCFLILANSSYLDSNLYYEWGFNTDSNWVAVDGTSGVAHTIACAGVAQGACNFTMPVAPSGTTYFVAVRSKRAAVTGEVGKWSVPVACGYP